MRLPPDLRLTPEQFQLVCAESREAVLELAADGRVIASTPTGSETGARNSLLEMPAAVGCSAGRLEGVRQLHWIRLPDGSVLSPDASVIRLDRWQALSPEQRRSFAPLCPDLVVDWPAPATSGPGA